MRYPKDHKKRSRDAIIKVAARLFRRHGIDGVGIDALMSAAGLTRGGFYGHFKSKSDLYEAVLASEHDYVSKMQAREGATRRELGRQGIRIASDYLRPEHRAGVLHGCSLASLAIDTARSSRAAQKAYALVVRKLAAEFGRGIDGDSELDDRALNALATSIGGLLLASACAADTELSEAIGKASIGQIEKTLGEGA